VGISYMGLVADSEPKENDKVITEKILEGAS
jgi:hypothetical protein